MPELLLRIPTEANATSDPLPATDLSSLYTYWIARAESRARGVRLGSDGAIVSHSIRACNQYGYISMDQWRDDELNERRYSDSRPPSSAEVSYGKHHLCKTYAILQSFEQSLEYLGQGYALQTGMAITEGWLNTDSEGRFSNSGAIIGGHATCTIGYDLDQGWIMILNSWPKWGRRSSDPMFSLTEGYTNIGMMPIEDYEKQFSQKNMQNGQSEAVVATKLDGFEKPLLAFDWTSLYTSGTLPA